MTVNTYNKKRKTSIQPNLLLKTLKMKDKIRKGIIKISVNSNKMKNRKTIEKNPQNQNWFFEKKGMSIQWNSICQ